MTELTYIFSVINKKSVYDLKNTLARTPQPAFFHKC